MSVIPSLSLNILHTHHMKHSTHLQDVDDHGWQVTQQEHHHHTQQHARQPQLSRLTPEIFLWEEDSLLT